MEPVAIENGGQFVYDPVTFKPDNVYGVSTTLREDESTTETVKKTSAIESVVALGPLPNPIVTSKSIPALSITGLGSQYPPFTIQSERLETYLQKLYDVETPG